VNNEFNNYNMENEKSKSIETNGDVSPPIRIEYLMHQYPWFSRKQIEEAVEMEDHKLGKILASLDLQSGSWPELYGF
jgi:hypothetical protein